MLYYSFFVVRCFWLLHFDINLLLLHVLCTTGTRPAFNFAIFIITFVCLKKQKEISYSLTKVENEQEKKKMKSLKVITSLLKWYLNVGRYALIKRWREKTELKIKIKQQKLCENVKRNILLQLLAFDFYAQYFLMIWGLEICVLVIYNVWRSFHFSSFFQCKCAFNVFILNAHMIQSSVYWEINSSVEVYLFIYFFIYFSSYIRIWYLWIILVLSFS